MVKNNYDALSIFGLYCGFSLPKANLLSDQVDGCSEEASSVPYNPHATAAPLTVNAHDFRLHVFVGHQQTAVDHVTNLDAQNVSDNMNTIVRFTVLCIACTTGNSA
jgi:hypothetical protein